MSTNIGENIRKARKALHMSQEALGELTGANRVTISNYENGEYNPSVPALKRLAEALHTTTAALTGDDSTETKKAPESGLDEDLANLMADFSPEQKQQVIDFAAFLISSRGQGSSPHK